MSQLIATRVFSRMALAALLLVFSSFTFAADESRIDTVSNKDFAATVNHVETTLKSKGLIIMARIDYQKAGSGLKGATTIEFGKPATFKTMLQMMPEFGLEFPHRFYIWERGDGKTIVSYRKPSNEFSTYGNNEMVAKMGNEMDGMFAMIVKEATK